MRTCRTCGVSRSLDEFYRHPGSGGHRVHCKDCIKAEKRKKYRSDERYREAAKARSRSWNARNAHRRRERLLRERYDLAPEDYEAMLKAQDGACAACGTLPSESGHLHVDHCHTSGAVRGLLCSNCNTALGLCNDNPQRLVDYLLAYAKYIERTPT